jgi:hypothetical protein
MLKKIRFSVDFKKLHCKTGMDGPGHKNLARRQDRPKFSGSEVWDFDGRVWDFDGRV